jgi:hypothetical protein
MAVERLGSATDSFGAGNEIMKGDSMMGTVSIIIGLGIIVFLIYSFVNRAKGRTPKVTSINRTRLKLSSKQACSYCKRKVDQLSFYSDRQGKVIGVCNVCKPQAERQALNRL